MEEWYRYIETKSLKVTVGERVARSRDGRLSVIRNAVEISCDGLICSRLASKVE
jgi:hypothetical protein